MDAIATENLTRDFGKFRALNALTVEVPRGEVFGFLGPNGAGKTTTIGLLLGLIKPTLGVAHVLGLDIRTEAEEVRGRCGALLEHTGLYEQFSALENLEFYARVWRMPSVFLQSRARELLTPLDLWERRNERVARWSRGMKQKLALARVLLHSPELVFLDEPTAGLDVISAASIRGYLGTLANREGVTIFLTTHNMTEAERICDRVAVIKQGELLAVGKPEDLMKRGTAPRVEIKGRGFTKEAVDKVKAHNGVVAAVLEENQLTIQMCEDVPAAPLVTLLVSAGAQIDEVTPGKVSLEDVFVRLVEEEK